MIPAPIVRMATERLTQPSRYDWMDDAACRGCNPDLWDTDCTHDTTVARAICSGCPVIAACAVAAKSFTEVGDDGDTRKARATHGIWAGVDMRSPRGARLLGAITS